MPKIKKATILGTAVPLAMFLLWNAVVLGALSGEDLMTSGVNPVDLLASKIESGYGTVLIDAFSFSACGDILHRIHHRIKIVHRGWVTIGRREIRTHILRR